MKLTAGYEGDRVSDLTVSTIGNSQCGTIFRPQWQPLQPLSY
jgi:hypothetical protein